MTHRWSLRETDLWNYSLSLQEIDKMRIDGKFVDAEGNRPVGQYVRVFFIFPRVVTDQPSGSSVPVETMLWSHLSSIVFERTCVRGIDADRALLSLSFVHTPLNWPTSYRQTS